jgi:hypothetical protein
MHSRKRFDGWSLLVMAESGVFLVSVKLILVGYKMSASNEAIQQRLEDFLSAIQQQTRLSAPACAMDGDPSRMAASHDVR